MKIRLLALDLDDTLLNDEFKVSLKNAEALRRAASLGVMVTLATGRMFRSALPFARELQLNLPLITYHGALIRTAGESETLFHQPVPLDLAKDVTRYCVARDFHVNAYIDDNLYVAEHNEYTRYYQSIADVSVSEVGDLAEYLQEPPTKLTVIDRNGRLWDLKRELDRLHGGRLTVTVSRPHFLEITDMRATKGQALKWLADRHGIPREQVAAIGDSYNDIDMLEYAGIGVAVGNAPREVKEAADYITASNTENGVSVFLEEFLFKAAGGN